MIYGIGARGKIILQDTIENQYVIEVRHYEGRDIYSVKLMVQDPYNGDRLFTTSEQFHNTLISMLDEYQSFRRDFLRGEGPKLDELKNAMSSGERVISEALPWVKPEHPKQHTGGVRKSGFTTCEGWW